MGKFQQRKKEKREALRKPSNMSRLKNCQHILSKVKITQKHPDEDEMEEVRRKVNKHLKNPLRSSVKIGTIRTYFRDERKRLKDNDELEDDSTNETKSEDQLNALQKLYEETKGTEEWKKRYVAVAEEVGLRPKFVLKWLYRKEGILRSNSLPKRSTRANPVLDKDSEDDEENSDRLSESDHESDFDKNEVTGLESDTSDAEKDASDEEEEANNIKIDEDPYLTFDEEMDVDKQAEEEQDHQDTPDEEMEEEQQIKQGQDPQCSAQDKEPDIEEEVQESDHQDSYPAEDMYVAEEQYEFNPPMEESAPNPLSSSNLPAEDEKDTPDWFNNFMKEVLSETDEQEDETDTFLSSDSDDDDDAPVDEERFQFRIRVRRCLAKALASVNDVVGNQEVFDKNDKKSKIGRKDYDEKWV